MKTKTKTLLLAGALATISAGPVAAGMSEAMAAESCYYMRLDIQRLDGVPHNQAECVKDPEAYLMKITRINRAISAGIVKQKAVARSQPIRISVTAQQACKAAIIRPYAKADFQFWGAKRWRAPGGAVMKGTVEIMNVSGAMIPHTYTCTFAGGTLAKAEVAPR